MRVSFPLLKISDDIWEDDDNGNLPIHYIKYFFSKDVELFERNYLNREYVDKQGVVYKLTGLKQNSFWLIGILSIFPFIPKSEFIFERTERIINLNELKDFLLRKIPSYTSSSNSNLLIEKINNCITIEEVLNVEI